MVINLLRHSSITFTKRNIPIFCLLLLWTALMPTGLFAQENASTHEAEAVAQHETHVTPAQALNVGYTFMRTGGGSNGNGARSGGVSKQAMQLVYTGQAYDSLTGTTTDCYYVFALQPRGFVIVAADDRVQPILGYSYDNNFAVANMPDHVRGWLSGYEEQIEAVVKQNAAPEAETTTKWSRLKSGQSMSTRSGESVGPLLTTQWDQWWPYNALCPDGTPTGCTATATAQIMNYWQWPAKGVGYYSYEPRSGIGTQSAWFNETYYQWDSMDVNHVDAISTLLYHVAVSMEMNFSSEGSGAFLDFANNRIKQFFNYSDSSFFVYRQNYSNPTWYYMLRNELLNGKPILYQGYNINHKVGHAFVLDGFDENNYFHCNFGWSGSNDGYYSVSNLYANIYDLNYMQGAVLGIAPNYSTVKANFEVKSDSTLCYHFINFTKGPSISYRWFFGDGDSSILQNPIHKYESEGEYTITLISEGEGGVYDTMTKNVSIQNLIFYNTHLPFMPNQDCVPAVLDYDMDGYLDLLVSGLRNNAQLYHNESNGFSQILCATSPESEGIVVDFFKENRPSLLFADKGGCYFHNDSGALVNTPLPFGAITHSSFTIGDYDGDGYDDYLADGQLYRNIGNTGLQLVSDKTFEADMFVDYDGDGDLDLLGNSIYRNDNGTFMEIPNVKTGIYDSYTGEEYRIPLKNIMRNLHTHVKGFADMDNNGLPDLVCGEYIIYNMGNDLFVCNAQSFEHTADDGGNRRYSTLTADLDCNGTNDIICDSRYYPKNCFIGLNHNGVLYELSWTEGVQQHWELQLCSGALIDFNNDNIPDYIVDVYEQIGEANSGAAENVRGKG